MNRPLVSIVMPVFNREAVVERAIASAQAQTHSHWELLVVDDGSTDGSRKVLERYGSQVTLLSQKNQGPFAARNLAIQQAKGEFIAFLDSDDVWLPRKLEQQLPLFDRPEVGLVFGDALIIDYDASGKGKERARTYLELWPPGRGNVFESLLQYDYIPNSSAVVRRACFDRLGPFSLKGARSSDYAKWVQIAMHYEMDYVPEPVFELSIHASNWSRQALDRFTSQERLFAELLANAQNPFHQKGLRYFLFNLKWNILLFQGKPAPETERTLAEVPITHRAGWWLQFLYNQTRVWLRIVLQKCLQPRRIRP